MQFLQFFSEAVIPITVFLIVAYGLLNRQNVFGDFLKGAKDGFYTVVDIFPTLVGLMCAVGILRASGFLDFFFQNFKVGDGAAAFPYRAHSGFSCEDVFFFCCYRAFTRFV